MKNPATRRSFLRWSMAGAAALSAGPLRAQSSFPNKPINVILGFAPGGAIDAQMRMVAPAMSAFLGQPIVIDNKPGAGGNLATELVGKAAPDGYTILFSGSSAMTVNPATYPAIRYDPLKDFTHIGSLTNTDLMIAINADVPAKTVQEFVALTHKDPTKYKYGDAGAGGSPHVLLELFKQKSGAKIQGVHYRGSGPMLPDLLANQIQLSCDVPATFRSHIDSGKLRGLMMVSNERNALFPTVPTAAEAGIPDMALPGFFGFHGPRGIPADVVEKLRAAIAKAQADAGIAEKLVGLGLTLSMESQQSFIGRIEKNLKLFQGVARDANIRIE